MPDPSIPFGERDVPIDGAGPYTFDAPQLAPGDRFRINLREYEENGTVGYYTVLSEAGYDTLSIENPTNAQLTVTVNENGKYPIAGNQSRSIEQRGIYEFAIKNESATVTTNAGDVKATILQSGYDSDVSARERRREPPIRKVIRKFTGV